MLRKLIAHRERWPLSRPFRISRGVKDAAEVVYVEAHAQGRVGQGESVPYARYGESVESVLAQIAAIAPAFEAGLARDELQSALEPGAARNALDCALWDLDAKLTSRSVAAILGVAEPRETVTAITISLDTVEAMAIAARDVADAPLIKVKVDAGDPIAAVEAVRDAAPQARLIVDPNESWSPQLLMALLPRLAALDVALLEQPVPAAEDAALEGLNPPVPICADEAAHTRDDLDRVAARYQAVNIKLDKTGGLTEALEFERAARARGLRIMIGCMVCTSLGIAPALFLTHHADFADLDGPWWLARDRASALRFDRGRLTAPVDGWGQPAASA